MSEIYDCYEELKNLPIWKSETVPQPPGPWLERFVEVERTGSPRERGKLLRAIFNDICGYYQKYYHEKVIQMAHNAATEKIFNEIASIKEMLGNGGQTNAR